MTQLKLVDAQYPVQKQCKDCQQWFEKATFPHRSARCKECYLARSRELSSTPEQTQKRKDRRANHTPKQKEAERERSRRKYANRTPQQKQHEYERRQSRKERDNARSRELRAQSPERRAKQAHSTWKSTLKHKYGITPDIHQMMYENPDGKCYFCGRTKPARGHGGLVIDHDKDTGFVRGLLCRQCNANFIDEYKKLPKEFQDSPRANAYLLRGTTGHYIEEIKQRMVSDE